VLVLETPDRGRQAAALIQRMQALRRLGGAPWSQFAVLARTRVVLEPFRALFEEAGIPIAWRDELPPLHRVREIAAFLDWLKGLGQETLTSDQLQGRVSESWGLGPASWPKEMEGAGEGLVEVSVPAGSAPLQAAPADGGHAGDGGYARPAARSSPWLAVIRELISAWFDEAGDVAIPAAQIQEFCYETLAEQRRDRSLGDGVLLSTLHGAKGMELPHVFIADGGWQCGRGPRRGEDERRLFYVGMTRARETLTLGSLSRGENPWLEEIEGDWALRLQPEVAAPPPETVARRYRLLTPMDVDLGYAGHLPPQHPIHPRLAALRTGDGLHARADGDRLLLCDATGFPVARLSARGSREWLPRLERVEAIKVVALMQRRREDGDPAFRGRCRSGVWEVPVVEIVTR
jgi:ATP-dependent DNA helicase RecQ